MPNLPGCGPVYSMFATGNITLWPGMAVQPQPVLNEAEGVSPSGFTTHTHASPLSCVTFQGSKTGHMVEPEPITGKRYRLGLYHMSRF